MKIKLGKRTSAYWRGLNKDMQKSSETTPEREKRTPNTHWGAAKVMAHYWHRPLHHKLLKHQKIE